MIVYIIKKATGKTRRLLSAYNYEVAPGIYVGSFNAGLFDRIFQWLSINSSKEQILIIYRNSQLPEGFEERGINWNSHVTDMGGLKLYRSHRSLT